MDLKRTFIISTTILVFSSIAFALTHTSQNYTLKDAGVVVSCGKATSFNYSLNDVEIGNIFGGKIESANYSLDATNIEKKRTPPNPPTLDPVISPTNVSVQTLAGTKDRGTSIYINGYEVVPLNNDATWSYDITLSEGDNYLIITARNQYGLESESVLETITLDTVAPLVNITSPADGTLTTESSISVTGEVDDDTASVSVNGLQATLEGNTFTFPDMPLQEGENQIVAAAEDPAGNVGSDSVVVTLDTTPPTGTIKINNDAQYTNSIEVTLSLSAQDNAGGSGLDTMQFSNDNVNWSTLEPYSPTKSWTLTSGNGQKTVYVKFKDNIGNCSQSFSDAITLDTLPPQIIITSPEDGAIVDTEVVTLQGTIDGQPFSETRTLQNEGDNTLIKEAADLAGNTSSASVTVYLYLGKAIGPEGGEVTSPDGRVKVIIPPGALSQAVRIKLLPLSNESLLDAVPQDCALLSVVECKPFGLNFNLPVQLIYSLPQAEVPGTPVELGFYDRGKDEIILTGQRSTVETDGYTVNFSVDHFSTYAALMSLVSQGQPIGGGVKVPLPDMFTGSFSHSVSISVPPGRKDMQPNLQLTYRSSNPNSWVGVGFSLNPGYIVRSTRLGPPTYDDEEDTFYFITDAGTTELVHLVDNLYQQKIESNFAKFFKEEDTWRVVQKDGIILRFGQTDESKETSDKGTFSWYLAKVTDTNGNYVEYSYTKDRGKSYLSSIEYTGNEDTDFSPTHRVEFSLEQRDDVSSSYLSGSKIATAKRLSEIQVEIEDELVWSYGLEYIYSQDTNRSLLKSVTQYGADGKAFPTQAFSYQSAK